MPREQHIFLVFDAPMMSFGGVVVDNHHRTGDFPTVSMLTGLLSNALGWRRTDSDALQRLQERLRFASRIDREADGGAPRVDFQTAQLSADDQAWTTSGTPEGRSGGPQTYEYPHIQYKEYLADCRVSVALSLAVPDEEPTLQRLAQALERPARPLFIGRKSFLPSAPIFSGWSWGDNPLEAAMSRPPISPEADRVRVQWREQDGPAIPPGVDEIRRYAVQGERDWRNGTFGGETIFFEGRASLVA